MLLLEEATLRFFSTVYRIIVSPVHGLREPSLTSIVFGEAKEFSTAWYTQIEKVWPWLRKLDDGISYSPRSPHIPFYSHRAAYQNPGASLVNATRGR